MAYYEKTKTGHRAHVQVNGQRDSATFPTKREAQLWAAAREIELQTVAAGKAGSITSTHDAMERYKLEVCPKHKGERWEVVRLNKMMREFPKIMLDKVTHAHVVRWRDERLGEVGGASVLREMKLLSSVFEKCCGVEWKLMKENPCKGIERPKAPGHRTRTINTREIRAVIKAMGFPKRETSKNSAAYAFLLALATGMRQGELAAITWANVNPNYIHTASKSMEDFTRDVPLSPFAKAIVKRMRGYHPESMFNLSAASLDVHFRKAKVKAGLEGFTFHDSRHTAATWIGRSGKLTLMEMCKAFGWKDPKHALIYFNPTGDDLSDKLK